MDSKKSLGVVGLLSVVALVAAVWLVARPSHLGFRDEQSSGDAVAPAASHGEKIALQFYRNPPAVTDVVFETGRQKEPIITGVRRVRAGAL
ncbi:MAG TPA: hypothetical protein VLV86_15145, partial [Vicinamibacterales bacterium]|nr:hypothetical protein [Vicinamibacterales bacterium]